MTKRETIEEAVLRVAKQQLKICMENHKDTVIAIESYTKKLQTNLQAEPWYATDIAFELSRLVTDYALLHEKIKGLKREIELLEVVNNSPLRA